MGFKLRKSAQFLSSQSNRRHELAIEMQTRIQQRLRTHVGEGFVIAWMNSNYGPDRRVLLKLGGELSVIVENW